MIEVEPMAMLGYMAGLLIILTGAGVLAYGAYSDDKEVEEQTLNDMEQIAHEEGDSPDPELTQVVQEARRASRMSIYSVDRYASEFQAVHKRNSVARPNTNGSVSRASHARTASGVSKLGPRGNRGSLSLRSASVLCAGGGFSPSMSVWVAPANERPTPAAHRPSAPTVPHLMTLDPNAANTYTPQTQTYHNPMSSLNTPPGGGPGGLTSQQSMKRTAGGSTLGAVTEDKVVINMNPG
eukprot:CAMPEP_0197851774 /NCGR_PEP_ID=MMETSP1438-20131217/18814_1 /TAXON_ID=1461541 /ORGANISM="Pterosperma sp., Strain CCMP1384" /LENGTH=237 /DNA_ID=CAMNT_0043465499 /DNA_START=95 /DNA_END=804 /DNA_ORIENTATION=-